MKQKLTIALSSILVALIIFWACQDDELPEPTPGVSNKITFTQVNSNSVSYRVIDVSVTIDNVADENIKEHGICYGTAANPTVSGDKIQQGSLSGNTYNCSIENLEPNTTYHVRAYLKFREATAYSQDFSFKTNPLETPQVENLGLSFSSGISLQVKGKIIDLGGDTINTKGICWSYTENPNLNDSILIDTLKSDTISILLTSINTDSTYYLKVFAINSVGAGYSNEIAFNTNNLPQITTGSVSDITNTGAVCGGTISDNGGSNITARGVCWSTNNNPTLTNSYTQDGTGTGTFTSTITNLDAATVYYVRAYATNETVTIYGNEQEFTTAGLPVLTTTAVINVTSTTATSGGNITDDGGYEITARGICWGTTTEPTLDDSYTVDGSGTGSYTSYLTGLIINTTYYVRAYATNANGTRYGNEISFTTHNGTPLLTTTAISNLTTNSATSGGNITSDEGNEVTARGVCWSTSSNPTISDNPTSEGSGTGSFVSNLSGLSMNTTYYLRAYATNSVGTNYGNEISFTTKDGIPVLTTTSITDIMINTATGGGNITDNGGSPITARGVCWSTNTEPTIADNITSDGSGTGNYSSSISGLTLNTTYYIRAYATNTYGTVYGNEITFTTKDGIPDITTTEITNITTTSATSGGNITDNGGYVVTERGVCWNNSINPTVLDSHTNNGSGEGTFTSSLSGLTVWTTYYVRAYLINAEDTIYGNELSFTTSEKVTDYDGNIYETVNIGNQIWMAENLKTTHYADGTAIPLVTDNAAWGQLDDNNTDDAYCYYNNNSSGEADVYGALYTWAAAMGDNAVSSSTNPSGVQGACPDGWHLPSDDEWQELVDFIAADGYSGQEGTALKSTSGWDSDGNGTDNYGFTALPGGIRHYDGGLFDRAGDLGSWWSSTEYSSWTAYICSLTSSITYVGQGDWYKSLGRSVRCLKD